MKDHRGNKSISIHDVLFVLFRHKWKIIICSALGLIAAGVVLAVKRPLYVVKAKLLVRYVLDTRTINPATADREIRSPDERGMNIINSELEILTSFDLVTETVSVIGADRILASYGGGTNATQAAGVILKNLQAEVPRRSDVIHLSLQHPDPDIAQSVLRLLILRYLEKHVEIHRAAGTFDFLQQQTDQLRSRLMQTEEELRKVKNQAGVISLAETKAELAERLNTLRKQVFAAEAERAEKQAQLAELEKLPQPAVISLSETGAGSPPMDSDEEQFTKRKTELRARERHLLNQFTEQSAPVQLIRKQIQELEKAHEVLLAAKSKSNQAAPAQTNAADVSTNLVAAPALIAERNRLVSLEAKIRTLNEQLEKTRLEAEKVDSFENAILQLQRKKDLEDAQYRYFSASLEQARIDHAVDSEKISNIAIVQAPTVAGRNVLEHNKLLATILAAGVGLGLMLALLSEFVLDQSVKRPADVELKLQHPLVVAIPDLQKPARRNHKNGKASKDLEVNFGQVDRPWDDQDPLRPFYEALRDRVVMSFGGSNHRPKLVGVTSCHSGAGVSRLAGGLAAALSRDVEPSVLLIQMTQSEVGVTGFLKGTPILDFNQTEDELASDHFLVRSNLHQLARRNGNGNGHVSLAQSFTELIPKLKVSDYDFIVFDMPPLHQTSMSLRLAGLMDKIVLVLESEATDRTIASHAGAILQEANVDTMVVLNKFRNYLPERMRA
ncbi:MAG: Wzz/FepE/Etk N-terminal domain-containing protein [Verrucomicrobiota bacterium]